MLLFGGGLEDFSVQGIKFRALVQNDEHELGFLSFFQGKLYPEPFYPVFRVPYAGRISYNEGIPPIFILSSIKSLVVPAIGLTIAL